MGNFFFPELPARYERTEDGIEFSKSEDFKSYHSTMRSWLLSALEEARHDAKQDEDLQKIQEHISYILGKQWPGKRPGYRASPVDNRIWGLVWELVSLLTDLRPVGQVKSIGGQEFLDSEKMLNNATKSWWLESDADQKLALVIVYAILGTGFAKKQWNPELRNGFGEFELVPISPLDCLCLKPKSTDLQSSQMVQYEQKWPLGKFRQKFGAIGATVKPDASLSRYTLPAKAPSHLAPSTFASLTPAAQALFGGGARDREVPRAFPMARYREFWFKDWTLNSSRNTLLMGPPGTNWAYKVKPGELLYPRGRLVCMGGDDVILSDTPNPYWHGQFPFDIMRLNIVPWQFLGVSDLRPLTALQDVINNILAGVIEMIKKAVNPPLIGPKNAFSESAWDAIDTAKTNLKLAVSPMATALPQFGNPPNLPSWVMTTLMLAGRRMEQSSGIAAVGEAIQKRQVPSGETLEKVQEVQQTPIRLKGRNIEVFLRNIGTMNISNIFQFYGPKRLLYMTGKHGSGGDPIIESALWNPTAIIPSGTSAEEHARQFVYKIHPGSLLNINHVEKTMTIMRLRMMGDIDRKTMYEILDLGINVEEIENNLKAEAMNKAKILANQRMVMMLQQAAPVLGPLMDKMKQLQGAA